MNTMTRWLLLSALLLVPGQGWATDRTDNFDRANNPIGTPSDGGSAWSVLNGTWNVISNNARESSGGTPESVVLESSISDVTVQATVNNSSVDGWRLVFRAADSGNYLYLDYTAGTLSIFKRVATVNTSLASTSITMIVTDVMKVTTLGTAIKAYQNGTEVLSLTDSTFQTNTLHGIGVASNTSARWDNFSITAYAGGGVVPQQSFKQSFNGVGILY